jgi:hypothetical protein
MGGPRKLHGDVRQSVAYNNLLLFLDEFDVFLDVVDVLLEGWRGAEHTLTALQLLESLVSVLHLLTLTELQVPKGLVVSQRPVDGRRRGRGGRRERGDGRRETKEGS